MTAAHNLVAVPAPAGAKAGVAETFGDRALLAMSSLSILDLAREAADRFELDMDDPRIAVRALTVGRCRKYAMILMMRQEEEVHQRRITSERPITYEDAVADRLLTAPDARPLEDAIDQLLARAARAERDLLTIRADLESRRRAGPRRPPSVRKALQ